MLNYISSGLTVKRLMLCALVTTVAGCASQSKPVTRVDSSYSIEQQRQAQAETGNQIETLRLKRKIALGRISNETLHGKSLLRDVHNDVLGKQVTDMLSKALTESGNFLVFERPDIGRLQDEAALTGQKLELIGTDALVIGSLTEFGRTTTGESGFLSASKKQTATAKVDLRLVDTRTAQIVDAFSGAGEASTENVNVAGFGSKADYDAAINDRAISIAIAEAVNKLVQLVSEKPWQSSVLQVKGANIFIAGGKSQGIKTGMLFDIIKRGEVVKSPQTGFKIQLPGEKIATAKVVSLFGSNETDEGAVVQLVSGSINQFPVNELVIQEPAQ